MLFSMRCVPLTNLPTRITTKRSTLLDHIYTNNVINNIKSYILLRDITDHLPICSIPSELKPYVSVETAYFRNTRNLVAEQFLDDLQTELPDIINDYLDNKDTNALFTEFTNKFSDILNRQGPSQKMTRKQQKLNQKPWINKTNTQSKTKLYKQFLTGSKEAEKLYKEVRNKFTHTKELAKK